MAYDKAEMNVLDVDTNPRRRLHLEASAAGKIFARNADVVVGSVKGNLGHLEAAAFLVSLLKACLILEHKIIPPVANFSVPSPKIDWNRHRLVVPTECIPLGSRSPSGRSIVSISGAGIGGSTGHVVIESPPVAHTSHLFATSSTVTFVVGGLSPKAVAQICQAIRSADFSDPENVRHCAVTVSRRARQMPWRTHFNVPISPSTEIPSPTLVPRAPPPVAFVFSGQGPQNFDMGRRLFAELPIFRATILELDSVFKQTMGKSRFVYEL
ncbi:thiolase-like protein [Mycena vitilis]|nr:thiolase-like protein [Mycena vitilis]